MLSSKAARQSLSNGTLSDRQKDPLITCGGDVVALTTTKLGGVVGVILQAPPSKGIILVGGA